MEKDISKGVQAIYEGILGAKEKENRENANTNTEAIKLIEAYSKKEFTFNNPENFYFKWIYPFAELTEGVILECLSSENDPSIDQKKSDIVFLLHHYEFLENNIKRLFQKYEGNSCSGDKSSTVLQGLIRKFMSNNSIIFNYSGEYTFHLPKKIMKTEEEILEVFDALHKLYYGYSDQYIELMKRLGD